MVNKTQAEKEAKALARSLGKGWKPTVWERGTGWHCCVVRGPLAVYPMVEGKYLCKITDKPEETNGKASVFSSTRLADTPMEAVKATVGGARIVVRKLETIVNAATAILDDSLKTSISMDFIYTPVESTDAKRS